MRRKHLLKYYRRVNHQINLQVKRQNKALKIIKAVIPILDYFYEKKEADKLTSFEEFMYDQYEIVYDTWREESAGFTEIGWIEFRKSSLNDLKRQSPRLPKVYAKALSVSLFKPNWIGKLIKDLEKLYYDRDNSCDLYRIIGFGLDFGNEYILAKSIKTGKERTFIDLGYKNFWNFLCPLEP